MCSYIIAKIITRGLYFLIFKSNNSCSQCVVQVRESKRFEINAARILGTVDFSSHFVFVPS